MFKNMKIAQKLIISFIAVTILASISGLVGLVLMSSIDTQYSEAMIANGFVQGDIGNFNAYLNKGGALARDVMMLTEPTAKQEAITEMEETKKLTIEALEKARVNCTSTEEKAILAKIDQSMAKFQEARDRAVTLANMNKNDAAFEVFRQEARPYLMECVLAGQDLMTLNVKMGTKVSADLTTNSNIGMMTIIIIIIVATGLSIALGVYISSSISRPVKACAKRLVALSEGDLHSEVPESTSKDETGIMLIALKSTTDFVNSIISEIGRGLGEMAKGNLDVDTDMEFKGDFDQLKVSINKILNSFNDTLGQINIASDQVSGGSDQVSTGAQALSQGATEQASSVEELAATINEISEQTKNNAANAVNASEKSGLAKEEVLNSNKKMTELIAAMEEIGRSSQEIGKVIKTIENIAFQTNILALNAAVEAARAGDAGKGFAVVADEVRNLASKSDEAAKGTTELIEGAIQAVKNGTTIADDTAKSLVTVVEGTQEVAILINKISVASNQQAISVGQVTQGIDQISSVVQTNSATAEESAAASEELSGQAALLKQLVSQFKLKKTEGASNIVDKEISSKSYDSTPNSYSGTSKY